MNCTTVGRREPVDRAAGRDPGPDLRRRDVEARDRHVLEPPARARAGPRAPRPAPPPRSWPGPGSPRAGARSACSPTASAPSSSESSRSGAGSRSSVSAVTDGPAASTSTREASMPARPSTRELDHREPLLRRRDDLAPLLPRIAGRHHEHPVEAQVGAHVDRGDDVADVDGVEGATEDPQPLRHARSLRASHSGSIPFTSP